nr:hypothetical protein [Tanacetum cinerariifolium]
IADHKNNKSTQENRVLKGRDVSDEKSREVFSVTPWAAKGGRRVLCYVQGSRRRKRKKSVGNETRDYALFEALVFPIFNPGPEFLRLNPSTLGEAFFKARITEACFEINGSLNADEYIGVEDVVGGGETLRIGKDDDLCNAVTEGGDDAIESRDYQSSIHSLIMEARVLSNRVERSIADHKNNKSTQENRVLKGRDVSDEKSREVFSVTPWAAKGGRRVLCYVQGSRRRKRKKSVGNETRDYALFEALVFPIFNPGPEFLRLNPSTLGEAFFKARITEACFEINGSLNADEYIGVEDVVGGGETLRIGKDDDLCNAVTEGGDDAIESRDYQSSIHSLIMEARVLSNRVERSVQRMSKCSSRKRLIKKSNTMFIPYMFLFRS